MIGIGNFGQGAWAIPIAFFGSLFTLAFLLRGKFAKSTLDLPNHRSLHSSPVPRIGGVGVLSGIFASFAWLDNLWSVLPWCVLLLGVVSLVDDARNLGFGIRLVAHVAAASMLVLFEFVSLGSWPAMILAVFFITWMTNLYNFMDGSDGLAGGMAIAGFATYSVGAWLTGNVELAYICAAITAASAGFLIFNFPPAKVFMGDTGSVPLGFFAAALGLYGWQEGNWPIWFPVLVFSPFIMDASATLMKRMLRCEKFWQAHRSHYYQRVIQMGWGHSKTALAEYLLMLAVAISALIMLNTKPNFAWAGLLSWLAVYIILMGIIDKKWSKLQQSRHAF